MQDDRDLMERVQRERDASAFETLYARYQEAVQRYLVRMVRDEAAAGDLAQETFLRVWTRSGQWDGRGAFRAWLFRIAAHVALNHLRSVRRRREQPLELPADPLAEEESPTPAWMIDAASLGPAGALELADRRERLFRLVEELPEEKREVARLAWDAEMDLREVAEALGIPEGTVRSRLHYARKRLREWDRDWDQREWDQEKDA